VSGGCRLLLVGGAALLTLTGMTEVAGADELPSSPWPEPSALTLPRNRVVLGAFSESAWGVTSRIELRAHPLWFWVLPHAEVKIRWLDAGPWQLSSTHRLAYPTPFLALVSREGSGGLLPATTDVPVTLISDNDLLASAEWTTRQWASVRLGLSAAVQGGGDEILLDFPFLYQRFAALSAPAVPKLALIANGELLPVLSYVLELRHYWLPLNDFPLAHATEYAVQLGLELGGFQRLGIGGRLATARLPIGWRSHFLPLVDYQVRF
jgi:hypothetical protein